MLKFSTSAGLSAEVGFCGITNCTGVLDFTLKNLALEKVPPRCLVQANPLKIHVHINDFFLNIFQHNLSVIKPNKVSAHFSLIPYGTLVRVIDYTKINAALAHTCPYTWVAWLQIKKQLWIRNGMHSEGVPLGSDVIPILVAAQYYRMRQFRELLPLRRSKVTTSLCIPLLKMRP